MLQAGYEPFNCSILLKNKGVILHFQSDQNTSTLKLNMSLNLPDDNDCSMFVTRTGISLSEVFSPLEFVW